METSPAASQYEITVNGQPQQIPADCNVRGLLGLLGMGAKRVAVARNRCVVPRSNFESETVRSGDQIEILEAVAGG